MWIHSTNSQPITRRAAHPSHGQKQPEQRLFLLSVPLGSSPDRYKKTPHKGEFLINGSDCRARTCDQSVNSRLLYHWAKSEWWRPVPELNRYKRICSPLHKPFCQPANFELPSTHSVSLYIQFFCFTSREIFIFFAHNFIFFWKPQKINLLDIVEK